MKKMMLPLLLMVLFMSCTNQDEFLDSIEVSDDVVSDDNNNDPSDDDTSDDDSGDDNSDNTNRNQDLLAFPGAGGAAAYATGGRGGRVIHVTNLNDNGPGSFREAMGTEGPRIIVFDISGTINLTSQPIDRTPPNVTVAGQTAPRGGITIRGQRVNFPSNSIVRYIRFRQDREDNSGEKSGVGCFGCNNFIMDHCSVSYGRDESILLWDNAATPSGAHTVQRTIIAEGKTAVILGASASDPFRSSLAGSYSFHHNLISHMHRTPNVSGDGEFEIYNNVIYNWHIRLTTAHNDGSVNHIGNYYKPGQITNNLISPGSPGNGRYFNKVREEGVALFTGSIYTDQNVYEGYSDLNSDNWNAWYNFSNIDLQKASQSLRANSPFARLGEADNIQTAEVAFDDVLNDVGANIYLDENGNRNSFLDDNDSRYVSDAQSGTDSFSIDQGNGLRHRWYANDPLLILNFPNLPDNIRPSGFDTDRDGMPDAWEIANGLNPNDPNDGAGDQDGDGYTNVEEYLNSGS